VRARRAPPPPVLGQLGLWIPEIEPAEEVSSRLPPARNVRVQLTPDELADADDIGRRRHAGGRRLRNTYGLVADDEEELMIDLLGARGEKVVEVATGLPWHRHLRGVRGPDVGHVQVRTPKRRSSPLRLYDGDDPDDVFVLVVPEVYLGAGGAFVMVGWIVCAAGRRIGYRWSAPGRAEHSCVKHPQLYPFPLPS
jgi:hypothetical protein